MYKIHAIHSMSVKTDFGQHLSLLLNLKVTHKPKQTLQKLFVQLLHKFGMSGCQYYKRFIRQSLKTIGKLYC